MDCSDSERRPLVVSLLDTDANMTAAVKYVGSDVPLFQQTCLFSLVFR